MFLRFQRGKSPVTRSHALCSGNPSPVIHYHRIWALCFHTAAQRHYSPWCDPASWGPRAEQQLLGWALCLLLRHLPECVPRGLLALVGAFLPTASLVNMKSSWLCFKWDWKLQQQGCVLHLWLVLSRRKACHGQSWFLDRTMPTSSLKNLEIYTCDLLWLIEILGSLWSGGIIWKLNAFFS